MSQKKTALIKLPKTTIEGKIARIELLEAYGAIFLRAINEINNAPDAIRKAMAGQKAYWDHALKAVKQMHNNVSKQTVIGNTENNNRNFQQIRDSIDRGKKCLLEKLSISYERDEYYGVF